MGVPLLLTWLRRRFTNCFLPAALHDGAPRAELHPRGDNLYVDLNAILYQAATIVSSSGGRFDSVEQVEDAVLRRLVDILDDLVLEVVQPQSLVYLAVDGIAPLGKVSQQRLRRRRPSRRLSRPQPGSNMEELWDSNCISVGTRFMAKVAERLHIYAVSRTERINQQRLERASASGEDGAEKLRLISIVVDDVFRPGEGENKIMEVIRRCRAQPDYNPNTTHIICSSDTDVTVSSLILHEPRMFVLRYNPPARLHHQGTDHQHGGGSSSRYRSPYAPTIVDSWQSTYFSIHLFRERLREILGTAPPAEPGCPATVDLRFEHALHDVVVVMLLFGNDFLPTIGGSIQEGTLDALLNLVATDMVSRGRTLVDPRTNRLDFQALRYFLDCLSEMRTLHREGVLSINGGDGGGASASWGFEEEPAHQQRRREQERRAEMKAYCYWSMLQWALQYSAGVVEHWGCYYPYSSAPSLQTLRKYCGVLSYESLVQFAAGRHLARRRGLTEEEVDAAVEMPLPTTTPNNNLGGGSVPLSRSLSTSVVPCGKPTDVLVQLLVLLPPRSVSLLPPILAQHYAEIEAAVQAPVEQLDLSRIEAWCREQRRLFSEEERTRYRAYELMAQTSLLEGEEVVEGAASSLVAQRTSMAKLLPVRANELTFMAHWDFAATETDVVEQRAAKDTSVPSTTAATSDDSSTLVSAQKKSASFFGAPRRGGASSAAAAALLAAATTTTATTSSSSNAQEDHTTPTTTITTTTTTTTTTTEASSLQATMLREHDGAFVFVVAPTSLLKDSYLERCLGHVLGSRFLIGAQNNATDDALPLLSRHANKCVRMQWRLCVAPPLDAMDVSFAAQDRLLPGLMQPERCTYEDAMRKAEEAPTHKRGRSTSPISEKVAPPPAETVEQKREAMRQRLERMRAGLPPPSS